MADKEKIKEILRRDLRPEARASVTEGQLSQLAAQISELNTIDESTLRRLSAQIIRDPNALICASVDVGDIKNELAKPRR